MRPSQRSTLAAATVLVATQIFGATPANAAPTTRYLDCSAPSGGNGSQSAPWNSLGSANQYTFGPGDQLLLKRGSTCAGQLKPKGSGSAGSPIKVAAYGTGTARPVVAGQGTVYAAVHLLNVEQWEIRDLEITNNSATAAERNGLLIELSDYGTGDHFVVDDVYVHDVRGDDSKWSNGIQIRATGSVTPTSFNDVIVRNSEIFRVDREGLTTRSTWMCRPQYGGSDGCSGKPTNWRANTNVIFRDNVLHDIGGDGIVMRVADHAIVEGNIAYDIAMRSPGNNAGIWTINSDHTKIQYNEVYRVRRQPGTNDGMAFDSDFGNTGTLIQYNYSHDNEGGFMLLCGACGAGSSTTGTIIRYNLSRNDGSRFLYAVGDQSAQVYNNTVYFPSGSTSAILQDGGGRTYTTLSNNIFYNLGSGGYGGSGYTPSDFTWRNNVFYGHHPANEPSDPGKITANPGLVSAGGTAVADYRLTSGSPAREAGAVVSGNGGRDYFGALVPQICRPDIGFHQASGFDDSACAPTNLVGNPGFETGALAPWTVWNRGQVDAANARTGSYGVRVGPFPGSVEQVISVAPNTTYRLSGWGKVSNPANTQVVIGVKNYGGPETRPPAFVTTGYVYGSVTFTTGATNTTAKIYCYARVGTGYGYCDDISVVPA